MPLYRISGLNVASDLPLPGAPALAEGGVVDVSVRLRPVPEALENPVAASRFWAVRGDCFLLSLPDIGRFMATEGHSLDMEPADGVDAADALPFLLGTGMGAILHQRGALVLHGSAVEWGGKAYVFCGPSGAGKSTLAAALCRAGCRLVADDIAVIALDADAKPMVQSDSRQLKLLDNSIRHLDLEGMKRAPVRVLVDKHYVEAPQGWFPDRLPLAAIHILRDDPLGQISSQERLEMVNAAQALLLNTYRPKIARAYAGDGRAMAVTAQVVGRVPVSRLHRPVGLDQIGKTVADLMSAWEP